MEEKPERFLKTPEDGGSTVRLEIQNRERVWAANTRQVPEPSAVWDANRKRGYEDATGAFGRVLSCLGQMRWPWPEPRATWQSRTEKSSVDCRLPGHIKGTRVTCSVLHHWGPTATATSGGMMPPGSLVAIVGGCGW